MKILDSPSLRPELTCDKMNKPDIRARTWPVGRLSDDSCPGPSLISDNVRFSILLEGSPLSLPQDTSKRRKRGACDQQRR